MHDRYARNRRSVLGVVVAISLTGLVGCSTGVAGDVRQPPDLPNTGEPAQITAPHSAPTRPGSGQSHFAIEVPAGSAASVSSERQAIVSEAVAKYAKTHPGLNVESIAVGDEKPSSSGAVIRGYQDGQAVLIGVGVKKDPIGWNVHSARVVATGGGF